jgi:hypothetical protein
VNGFDPNKTTGALAHIPADVFEQMPRAEIVFPSAVVPAEYAARQNLNVVSVFTADGREILVNVDAFAQHAASVAVQRKPIPRWVISSAILMPVASGSFTLGAWGLSLAVPAFVAFVELLRQLFYLALVIGAVLGMFALSRKSAGGPVTVTATSVSRGFLSKATATATAIIRRS